MPRRQHHPLPDDPLWYKDGIIYQLHVKAFFDSSGDGIGDFNGLRQKLSYLHDLGVTSLWLLPFYPSPLRDDGYDIASYEGVHPNYGTLDDFKLFLDEAHRQGLRVITELVINHTSDQHPWFQRARRAPKGSVERDFYVWSDDPNKYKEARIIFKDFETSNWTWDPVADAYYWHRFFHHQPDLNFESPEVKKGVFAALDLWMEMGVDGLRLDAIPYLYEREGTSCENLPETHTFLKQLRAHLDRNFRGRMLLAEANQWPEDSLPYFGDGDECHVAFHFPLMPRLFMAVAMEDRHPIIDILEQTPEIPPSSQWALFLRNHDELTLEMVTEEDRDYMYRTYARERQARINLGIRRRLAPLLENHRRRIELMNALLFSFPGTPILYYGDEIGMGDNIYLGDRNGVRTPMQWSPDRNAGFSRANPQRLYLPVIIDPEYHYEAINVEAQQNSPHSLLWWMKRLIDVRKQTRAFGRGSIEFLHPENGKILAFIRHHEDETILVVANLSRFVQVAELDLSRFKGMRPIELFGFTSFPKVKDQPYPITLGPHAFYWLRVEKAADKQELPASSMPALLVDEAETVSDLAHRSDLLPPLQRYIESRRWFGGKARRIRSLRVIETLSLPEAEAIFVLVRINYVEGSEEKYLLPIAIDWREGADSPLAIARVTAAGRQGIVHEPLGDPRFTRALLQTFAAGRALEGETGSAIPWSQAGWKPALHGSSSAGVPPAFERGGERMATWMDAPHKAGETPALHGTEELKATLVRGEQSNTSILYGDRHVLKLYRRLEEGLNGEVEMTRFLTEKTSFRNAAPLAGALEYRGPGGEPMTLAMLQDFVPNSGDAWRYTIDAIGRYLDQITTHPLTGEQKSAMRERFATGEPAGRPLAEVPGHILGGYTADAELLGRRTAEMHLALTSIPDDPDFAPEPFTPHYQRSIYQSMRSHVSRSLTLLRRFLGDLAEEDRGEAGALLELEGEIQQRLRPLVERNISARRARCHGDYHLGQILRSGHDFVIIDFEGEPARPLSERRIKRSPLRDVAGMLRSFDYAVSAVLMGKAPGVPIRGEDAAALEPAAALWRHSVGAIFLRSYLDTASAGAFLPKDSEDLELLVDAFLIEKAAYELAYELGNRPEWVGIPIRGMLRMVERSDE